MGHENDREDANLLLAHNFFLNLENATRLFEYDEYERLVFGAME